MSGYRAHGFDPNDYELPGKPLKPYNWVQWTGVAIVSAGLVATALDVAGRLGWIPLWIDGPSSTTFVPLLIGVALINSRREPGTPVTGEQRARNRKTLIVTAAICAAVLGAVTVIEFSGA